MISGRTFAREMIALRQRETKRAGRILALQGQNPGQLELRTHSEFGANLSVTPGALPSSVLELSLEEAVQPDIILSGSALRKQNHSISFSSHRCQTPGTEDSASPTTTPDASSAHFTFNKKESREQDSLLLTNYIFHIGSSSAKP